MRVGQIDWWLDVRYREKTFSGRVAVRFDGASDPLTLDSSHLTITSATLDGRSVEFRADEAKGALEFAGLSGAPHVLEIAYRGAVDPNSLVGFYVSPAGPGYCLTTMLFPTGSRTLLPSFEAPAVKAVYRLVLTVDADVKAIFNTGPQSETLLPDGRREVTFAPTPRMSAYLLYLGIGPFDTLTVPGHPWSVTVAASPGRAPAGRYCAERASEILAAYEEYYGIPYPLPKLDLVALENFWAGAMENWGAIAFREGVVLVDPNTTVRERRVNLLVLAHEVAHQWFGNLVTPSGWDDFWLNESFATFVGHHIVGRRYPEELPWPHFMNRFYGRGLIEDSFSTTHPVKVPVASAEELGEIVDDVTYGKGASVLRMIEAYLGEANFRRGVSQYLSEHQYANARAEDLWGSLADVSRRPVDRIMTSWITQPGYPVVRASWSNGTLTLRQARFRADGAPAPGLWPIPMRVSSPLGEHSVLFETSVLELLFSSPEGLRVNPERTAFVRVQYDDALFGRMLEEFPSWSPIDQWGVVVDTLAFVYAEMSPLSRFLELVRASSAATEEAPVEAVVFALRELYVPLHDVSSFVEVAQKYLATQMARVGLDRRPGESDSSRLFRELFAVALVGIDLEFARTLSSRFREIDRDVPELRPAIALAFARVEGSAAFDPLVDRLRSTSSDAERAQTMWALGGLKDPGLLRRALDLIPSPGVTPAGALQMLLGMLVNPEGGAPLFEWYRERSESISKMWAGTGLLSLALSFAIPTMGLDREELVESFFRDHAPPEAPWGVAKGLEGLHLWSRLRHRERRTG